MQISCMLPPHRSLPKPKSLSASLPVKPCFHHPLHLSVCPNSELQSLLIPKAFNLFTLPLTTPIPSLLPHPSCCTSLHPTMYQTLYTHHSLVHITSVTLIPLFFAPVMISEKKLSLVERQSGVH